MFDEIAAVMKISFIFIPLMLCEYLIIKTMNALAYPFSSLFTTLVLLSLPLTGMIYIYLLYITLFETRGGYYE